MFQPQHKKRIIAKLIDIMLHTIMPFSNSILMEIIEKSVYVCSVSYFPDMPLSKQSLQRICKSISSNGILVNTWQLLSVGYMPSIHQAITVPTPSFSPCDRPLKPKEYRDIYYILNTIYALTACNYFSLLFCHTKAINFSRHCLQFTSVCIQ